ncbi:MAG: hypothetical protein ACFFDT_40560, partial [Candidatus Hodarchaeota archaeon]
NYLETGEKILETIRERYSKIHSEIYLEPLDEKQCEVLIHNLIKVSELPRDIKATITSRTEGNPFFIEEVVRSFIDEGVIELRNGGFTVTEKFDSVVIPETIQDVLMARIDRLDETTKSLLKEASVIGRYFFYKILAEVTKATEDIDDRLEYLKDIQLIRERMRMEEIEYLFEHALAQEVTYESILLKKRRELHLKVATTIESVFSERLHEFYGMLALHYSKGENLEKAEEFLIKAGEEALKAAASNEALHYYQEALKLYLKKSGDAADPEKIAMLEKNIAVAFYNKGRMVEALEHFDKALKCFGVKISENRIVEAYKFLITFMSVIKNLYWPSKKAKKSPGNKDIWLLDLLYKKGVALALIAPKRYFMETISLIRILNKFELKGMEDAGGVYSAGSALFSVSGISIAISQKFLNVSKKLISENDVKSLFMHKSFEMMHNFHAGNWDREYENSEELINTGLRLGELFNVIIYVGYYFYILVGRGEFKSALSLNNKISQIYEAYDYDFGRFYEKIIEFIYRLEKRNLYDISKFADACLNLANKLGLKFWNIRILGLKAKAQILLKNVTGAEESLRQAKQILLESGHIIPLYSREFIISQFLFDVYQFKELLLASSLRTDKLKIKEYRMRTHKSGKDAVKLSHKVAEKMPEVFRLVGTFCWLKKKLNKALNYWDKSIKSAEHLGARPELARTYMEVGERLLEKKSKFQQLNGIQAEEYLEKARVLFQEMELEWDLEELSKIKLNKKLK